MGMFNVSVTDMIEFSDTRRVRKKLITEALLEAELVCYEPGQDTRQHFHKTQEEIYYIVEGSGSITIGDETTLVKAGDMVFSPADVPHSIATADERMVMFFVKGPGRSPTSVASGASTDG
jgi:quercetin dioxygenase-like cupin family protein